MHVSGLAIQRALRHIRPGTRQELARFRLGQHPAPKPHMLPPGGFSLGTQLAFEKATPSVRSLPTDLPCIEPPVPRLPQLCTQLLGRRGRVSSLIEYVVSLGTGHVTRHCPGKLWHLAQHSRQSAPRKGRALGLAQPRKVIAETLQQRSHLRRYGRTMFGQCCLATGSDRINSCATPALVSLN